MNQRDIEEQSNIVQTSILNFTNRKRYKQIEHRGYINQVKYKENTRILSININGLNLQNNEKIDHILEIYKRLQIDIIFITEPNMK